MCHYFPAVLVHGKGGWTSLLLVGWTGTHCQPPGMKVDEPTYHIPGQEYRDMNLALSYSGIFLVYSQQNLSTTNWNYLFSVLTNHVAKLEWEPELCILVHPVNSYSYIFTQKAWKKVLQQKSSLLWNPHEKYFLVERLLPQHHPSEDAGYLTLLASDLLILGAADFPSQCMKHLYHISVDIITNETRVSYKKNRRRNQVS